MARLAPTRRAVNGSGRVPVSSDACTRPLILFETRARDRMIRAAHPVLSRPRQLLLAGSVEDSAVTLAPGRTRDRPLTTTFSSPFSPSRITR